MAGQRLDHQARGAMKELDLGRAEDPGHEGELNRLRLVVAREKPKPPHRTQCLNGVQTPQQLLPAKPLDRSMQRLTREIIKHVSGAQA